MILAPTSNLTSQSISYDSNPRIEVSFETDRTIAAKNIDIKNQLTTSFEGLIQSFSFDKKQSLVEKAILQLNETINFDSKYFESEEISLPNEKAKNYATLLIEELSQKNIYPVKISTLAEEGILFSFKNKSHNMFFEIYNDGDVGYIIEDYILKKVIDNKDCFSFTEAIADIESFYI